MRKTMRKTMRKKTAFLVFSRISKKKFFKEQKALKKLFLGFYYLREKREREKERQKNSLLFSHNFTKKRLFDKMKNLSRTPFC